MAVISSGILFLCILCQWSPVGSQDSTEFGSLFFYLPRYQVQEYYPSRPSGEHVIYVANGDVVLESDTFERPIEGDSVTFEWYTFDLLDVELKTMSDNEEHLRAPILSVNNESLATSVRVPSTPNTELVVSFNCLKADNVKANLTLTEVIVVGEVVNSRHITTITFYKVCSDVGTSDTSSGPDGSLKNILYIIMGLVALILS